MYDRHLCPFYEEHSGEYYQGCWEFYDLCWCSQELGLVPNCYTGCFLIRNDEEQMLEVCIEAMDKPKEVYHFKGPKTFRNLTKSEKQNIIEDMETFMRVFNDRFNPPLIYK